MFRESCTYFECSRDGAEVEASFEHTRNLLQKQCALFDEAVCRCSKKPGWGSGCDGQDSDCDDFVDECDEDTVPPQIDVRASLKRCDSWLPTLEEAEACVLESVIAEDDCQNVTATVKSSGTCENGNVTITVTEDDCNKTSSVTVPIKIDNGAPKPTCNFNVKGMTPNPGQPWEIKNTGARLPTNVGFTYSATDNCDGPLNVTVDVYSSEIEDFNAQEM